jgi:hypothetical protein
MLTRPRHGDNWKLYYVPYLMERTTPHYLLWGPHSDFSKCWSYFCRTLYVFTNSYPVMNSINVISFNPHRLANNCQLTHGSTYTMTATLNSLALGRTQEKIPFPAVSLLLRSYLLPQRRVFSCYLPAVNMQRTIFSGSLVLALRSHATVRSATWLVKWHTDMQS